MTDAQDAPPLPHRVPRTGRHLGPGGSLQRPGRVPQNRLEQLLAALDAERAELANSTREPPDFTVCGPHAQTLIPPHPAIAWPGRSVRPGQATDKAAAP